MAHKVSCATLSEITLYYKAKMTIPLFLCVVLWGYAKKQAKK